MSNKIQITLNPQQALQLFSLLDSADERKFCRSLDGVYEQLQKIATHHFLSHYS